MSAIELSRVCASCVASQIQEQKPKVQKLSNLLYNEMQKKMKRERDQDDSDKEEEETPIPQESEKDATKEVEEPTTSKRKRKRKRKKKAAAAADAVAGDADTGGDLTTDQKMDSLEHTVYVEGIPFDCSEDKVKNFFSENGCPDVIQLRLPRWQDSGRLRGFGHVVFDTVESRSKALDSLNGKHLGRRYLNIQAPKPSSNSSAPRTSRPQPDGCKTIFVKNLPYAECAGELQDVFSSCGKIVPGGIRLARNYQTNQCKGFGYIEFKNPEGAYSAVQRANKPEGLKIMGRRCVVDYEEGTMKGSFRDENGKNWQKEHGSVHEKIVKDEEE